MPPNHPSVTGPVAIEAYFRDIFSRGRFQFQFSSSEVVLAGQMAVERVTYTVDLWPAGGGTRVQERGKGVHVYRRQEDGSWKLRFDIWSSDQPRP